MASVTHASDLGIDLAEGKPQQLYRWFLASLLFGRPIQQEIAAKTYHALIDHGLTSPKHFAEYSREGLRAVLDDGGYGRFDYQMTDALHEAMATIAADHGSVAHLVSSAKDRDDLRATLTGLKGVGPKVVEIFLRAVPDALLPD
jgi:3-methyladenine DNA glycosylase/8-oxoguanine DNA glycosylase